MKKSLDQQIVIVGLGYVGLPLALAFAKHCRKTVIGFDISQKRISELQKNYDYNEEFSASELKKSPITYSSDPAVIKQGDFVIVAVPTPITAAKKPDLSLVKSASALVGKNLKKGAIVVFESTVYPGVTEDICLPIIEKNSGLKQGSDWSIGYSPERVNPGDKEHSVEKIIKIVSGSHPAALDIIAATYQLVCTAGVHRAPNIKTAEAAKVIENIQRDLNIALVNELALIFARLDLSTSAVLQAASTKWNFHPYHPGLVGGHCIGVDPYYLTYCAKKLNFKPRVILAGRKLNDAMPGIIAQKMLQHLDALGKSPKSAKILIMGLTFKENVKDIRNSKSAEIIQILTKKGAQVIAHDPLLEQTVHFDHGVSITNIRDFNKIAQVDGIIVPIIHAQFKNLKLTDFQKILRKKALIIDIRSHFHGIFEKTPIHYDSL